MNPLSSLRSRIFLASGLLAVLAIGAAIYLVSVRVTREFEDALQREITATGAVFEQVRTTRADTMTMRAKLIADNPRLKAAVDTNDPPTVQDVSRDYQEQLDSTLLVVTNRAGDVLATAGAAQDAALEVARQPAVRDAAAGRIGLGLMPHADGMLQFVTVPIFVGLARPDILGTLSVGFLLDEALARQLKEITGSEIAFGMHGRILASTLPAEDRVVLAELLRRAERALHVTLRTQEYVVLPLPLSPGAASEDRGVGPVALVLRSRTEQLRFLQSIHSQLALAAAVTALLAFGLSFAVARSITRPLGTITSVMREVAATGDLTRKIALSGRGGWDDEDAKLLAATFNTLTDSIARFQREMSQKERLSSLGRLSTVIAHEVRNPLMIIKAALHSLRQPGQTDAALREAASDIEEEVARLNRIVNDVLDFARPIQFDFAPADVNALCRESAAAAQATPGAVVQLDLDPAVPPITTDAERLRLALVNLIVNARQAIDGSTRSPAPVSVTSRLVDDHVTIAITDNGAGIAGSDLARVFDPYFTTKRGGTGLGLPIARNIIEGLGGTISIDSRQGRGTEMRIDLPMTGAPAQSVC
jgi:signal transduction histidine kinase